MNDYRIHQHYAKALYLLAADMQQVDQVMEDMTCVAQVCRENPLLVRVMANPTIRVDKKQGVIGQVFDSHLTATSMAFLHFVVHRKRAVRLRGIAETYMQLYRDAKGIVLAHVRTATDMDANLVDRLRSEVEQFTGRSVQMDCVTTDKMMGGFQLLFDTYLYDARLQTRIDRMRRAFNRNDYESKL